MLLIVMFSPSMLYHGVYRSESSGLAESGLDSRFVGMAAPVVMIEPVDCGVVVTDGAPTVSDGADSCALHPSGITTITILTREDKRPKGAGPADILSVNCNIR